MTGEPISGSIWLRSVVRELNRVDLERVDTAARTAMLATYGERHRRLLELLAEQTSPLMRELLDLDIAYRPPLSLQRRVAVRSRVEDMLARAEAELTSKDDIEALAALLEDVLVSLDCL